MTADRDLVLGAGAKLAGRHDETSAFALDTQHRLRRVLVKLAVQTPHELHGRRVRQSATCKFRIEGALKTDVLLGLEL